ncbi:MAG: WG repeat-containing protein [Eubacteriales bacterium]|nr:WG repeat-containing protein [Eubacteriales bacterium]
MKNYRKLVPIVLIILMIASSYILISDSVKSENQYEKYLADARSYAEKGITKYAIENYTNALQIKDDVTIYVEVAKYYKTQAKEKELVAWCEDFLDAHPTAPQAYDCMLEAYMSEKDYASCYDILYMADKRNVSTEYTKTTASEIQYTYKLDFNSYSDVGIYGNNFCAVKSKDVWGFVDRFGEQRVSCKYLTVGAYTQSGFVSVVNSEGEAYFIDKTGSKVLVSDEKYKEFGLLVDEIMTAKGSNDKYKYVDQNFKELFGDYDYASTMNNDIAAVMIGDKWSIIDNKGTPTTDSTYSDIKIDEKKIAYRNDRLFVKTDNGYVLVNSKGKQISETVYEDAMVFADTTFAAVKSGGKWGYIDKDGKIKIEPTFEDARSFCNGLAAVKINGKWGFINENGELCIDAVFFDAKDFNEKGSCFVMTGDKWQLLKLYRLNREE